MAIRRQAYEWRNVCPIGNQFTIGHPVLDPNPIVPPVSLDLCVLLIEVSHC